MVAVVSGELKDTHRRFLEETARKSRASTSEINRLYSPEGETALQKEIKLLRSVNEVLQEKIAQQAQPEVQLTLLRDIKL